MKTAALIALLGVIFQDGGTTYYVGHHEKFVNIAFESDAAIEFIVGTTHKAAGEIKFNKDKGNSVSLTVPVDSMKTGIDMRDEHLRSANWMDAAMFPSITFVSKKSEPVKDKPDQVQVTGDFSLHGVSKEIVVTVSWKELSEDATKKAGFGDGKWVKFATDFEIKLSDYGIKVPEQSAAKVSDAWKVKMVIYASTAKPEAKK